MTVIFVFGRFYGVVYLLEGGLLFFFILLVWLFRIDVRWLFVAFALLLDKLGIEFFVVGFR